MSEVSCFDEFGCRQCIMPGIVIQYQFIEYGGYFINKQMLCQKYASQIEECVIKEIR